jgi:nucleoside-diphosphate-sugar epimerase
MKSVLVTGGSGFIGKAVMTELHEEGFYVRGSARRIPPQPFKAMDWIIVPDLCSHTDWKIALGGIDTVIHCAGIAHIFDRDSSSDPALYRAVNVDGTLNLAKQAADAGIRRFIFLSSISVNGFQTTIGEPFSELDSPNPYNNYSASKYEAELALLALARSSAMEVVIIRPPMVYGPSAPGNFKSLIELVRRQIPLPLKAIKNKRSLIGIENLTNFIKICVINERAANQVFVICDGYDVSTAELIESLAFVMNKRSNLFKMPNFILKSIGIMFGKKNTIEKISGNLQINNTKARELLGWAPPYSFFECLQRSVHGGVDE